LEAGLFKHYENLLSHTESLLNQKQQELDEKLKESRRKSTLLLFTPFILAIPLLILSRLFLKRAIVRPIEGVLKATTEISAGHLTHRAPDERINELATLSNAINEMADKLQATQKNLIRSEKQAAQGLLVPMLAHNIRNPLASIRATAQVMLTPGIDEETCESLHGIINTVDRLERWTGALLAYLHPLKPQLSQVSIKDIVDGAIAPLQQKLAAKTLTLTLPDWSALVRAKQDQIFTDQHLLEQVLYNLLLNAADATQKNGIIEIMVKIIGDKFIVSILDQGNSMPFTPDPSAVSAPTTKRFGTGIGIPFSFKVCDSLNAKLTFSDRPDGGTMVRITLPKHLEQSHH